MSLLLFPISFIFFIDFITILKKLFILFINYLLLLNPITLRVGTISLVPDS